MSGLSKKAYKRAFRNAENDLLDRGYKVMNPARWGWLMKRIPYRYALALDILMMCKCDTVYMLDGWQESKGARAERRFAKSVGMEILYQP